MLECSYFSTSAFESSYDDLEQKVDHFIELMTKISKQEEVTKLSIQKDVEQTSPCSISPLSNPKEIIDEISRYSKELNDEVFKLVQQLNELQYNIEISNVESNLLDLLDILNKKIPKSAETYVKYVDCLVNMSSLKRLLKQNEKSTLMELNVIRYGLRDISITTKDLFIQIRRKASPFKK